MQSNVEALYFKIGAFQEMEDKIIKNIGQFKKWENVGKLNLNKGECTKHAPKVVCAEIRCLLCCLLVFNIITNQGGKQL